MTDNAIDEAACDQLLEWFRLPVPLELKASLCARVVDRQATKISDERVDTAGDQLLANTTHDPDGGILAILAER